MMGNAVRKWMYSVAYDTRCRNMDVARVLRPLVARGNTILDAGCGEFGLAAFIRADKIVGVDITPAAAGPDDLTFVYGSIVALPFRERSFSIATSVDVLEHLPASIRNAAVEQLVRVADRAFVITFPAGKEARRIDEAFHAKLTSLGQPIPDWLEEHLQHPYPESVDVVAAIETEASRIGRRIETAILYSENLSIARALRWAAARSSYLYMMANLAAGVLLPFLPRPDQSNAYRSIVVAQFKND